MTSPTQEPDTLASLPAKWREEDEPISDRHARELEAALVALAEKWEEKFKDDDVPRPRAETYGYCAAELRGIKAKA